MFGLKEYQYAADETLMIYYFDSNVPCGLIRKIARFTLIGDNIYNFGFGDYDRKTRDISDLTKSANGDVDVIMGTIGSIIYDFTNTFSHALIFVKGSTPARTRLYQSNINKHWENIKPLFDIWGYLNDEWVPFEKGVNYDAFLGFRK